MYGFYDFILLFRIILNMQETAVREMHRQRAEKAVTTHRILQ